MADGRSAPPAPLTSRPHVLFLVLAYGFSWPLWILAWLIARSSVDRDLLLNERLVWEVIEGGAVPAGTVLASAIALVAVYGPMIAGLAASSLDPATSVGDLWARMRRLVVGGRWYVRIALILAIVTLVPPLAVFAASGSSRVSVDPASWGAFVAVFALFQLLTSGTEEIGWRGYLLDKLRAGRGLWDQGWVVGVPWALWHLPVVLVIFAQQGLAPAAMVASLLGFGLGIVAISILHAWIYAGTRSVFLAIVVHASFNTMPLAVALLVAEAALLTTITSQLLLWAIVLVIVRRSERQLEEVRDAN